MKPYSELINISKQFDLEFYLEKVENLNSLKLSNHFHPWSLLEEESQIVYDIIIYNNLKYGFEIGTGFGISTSIIGQALKKTNGNLITIDAYVEEHFNLSTGYNINTKFVKNKNNADGYKMANKLIEHLDIQKNVFLEIGWTPNDIKNVIEKNNIEKMDFVFIDGGHSTNQIYADVKEILLFSNTNFLFFFHDFHCVGDDTISLLNENGFNNFKRFESKFDLVVYTNNKSFIINNK